jgi:cell wall-associated NlpC family hydrolase
MTLEQRVLVVSEAQSWVGTPYRVKGKVKGVGVDCAMILEAVYEKILPGLKIGKYSYQHANHNSDKMYTNTMLDHGARELEAGSDVMPGDIVVYFSGLDFSHSAIVVNWPNEVIHASSHGVRLTHGLYDPQLQGRRVKFFTVGD